MNNSLYRISHKGIERFTDLLRFAVSLKVVCVFFAVALSSTLKAQDSGAEVVDVAVPPDVQLDVIRQVLSSRSSVRAILAQKPLGMDYQQARQIVTLAGDIMTLPGLPSKPNALDIDLDDDGQIVGVLGT